MLLYYYETLSSQNSEKNGGKEKGDAHEIAHHFLVSMGGHYILWKIVWGLTYTIYRSVCEGLIRAMAFSCKGRSFHCKLSNNILIMGREIFFVFPPLSFFVFPLLSFFVLGVALGL